MMVATQELTRLRRIMKITYPTFNELQSLRNATLIPCPDAEPFNAMCRFVKNDTKFVKHCRRVV